MRVLSKTVTRITGREVREQAEKAAAEVVAKAEAASEKESKAKK